MGKTARILFVAAALGMPVIAAEYYVDPDGSDSNAGAIGSPFGSIAQARDVVRRQGAARREPVTVYLREGTHYLAETLVLTEADSATEEAPITYSAYQDEKVVVSGGSKLSLAWKPYREGILQARTSAGPQIDQLFVNGRRRHMARYPNYDPDAHPYNGSAADAFSPERAAGWADPAGGYIHAMHRNHWGGYHYRITGKKPDNTVVYEGGWQNNRQMGMHGSHRFVENIFEELDAPGEWFHDAKKRTLYYFPVKGEDVGRATFEIARLRHLIELRRSRAKPVRHVTFRGLVFRHAARTFMETKEPLLRSDWTICRGGAVVFEGAEDCAIADCEFDQVGGNAVFVSNYNRRIAVRGTHIHGAGASGICFVGDPNSVRNPLFEYGQRQDYAEIDQTPGPKTDDYPADCTVEDSLIHGVSVVEKQATGVQVSMSRRITIRHCSIYEVGRAGINLSEGTFGGHLIEFCDVFDTVRETGDHGSFNSWGRDRFWELTGAPAEELPALARLDADKTTIRNSRWRCDRGWDVDLDDGSSNYDIYNNLFLRGGLKLREGFHRRVWNNIAVNNGLHPHVWYGNSMDVVTGNIWMAAHRPAGGMPKGRWGQEVDRNLFLSEANRTKFAGHGCDANSIVGDPMFVDPENGDYRVKPGSPAFRVGFKNFPMDRFGVQKPELKAIARAPEFPALHGAPVEPAVAASQSFWQGAAAGELSGEEFSAFGVRKEDGGIHLRHVPDGSFAFRAGLRAGDLVQSINGIPTRTVADLLRQTDGARGKPLRVGFVRGQKNGAMTMASYVHTVAESTAAEFETIQILPTDEVLPFVRVTTSPGTANEPLGVLSDGKLAENYGPVFRNGVVGGTYKVDLGRDLPISAVGSWSFRQGGVRGRQRFALFGINGQKPKERVPLAMVDTVAGPDGTFVATRVQVSDGGVLGSFRWLEWVTQPVTGRKENTAFQEFQVR